DPVIDIEPFRMVVLLFGLERDPRHEPPGLAETAEFEAAGDGVATVDRLPARQRGERGLARGTCEFLDHGRSPPTFYGAGSPVSRMLGVAGNRPYVGAMARSEPPASPMTTAPTLQDIEAVTARAYA